MHQPSLFDTLTLPDHACRTPREDLTPADLLSQGWVVMPSVLDGLWAARRGNRRGGSVYSGAYADIDAVVASVRPVMAMISALDAEER